MQKGESEMSWGYVPKKLKQARRQKILRKKYGKFSCTTCQNRIGGCQERYKRSPWWGLTIVEDCKYWKAPSKEKTGATKSNNQSVASNTEKKQSRKGIFKRIFK